ncbi:MAG: hypothetical protein PHT07_21480 [Paludibacter sp.]|nr:hypothetical protein [Paludibacter sp.]
MSITLFEKDEERQASMSTFKNPFSKNKCSCINIIIRNDFFTNYKTTHTANVDFENGDTKGSHTIKADDFPSLIKAIEAFIESL